MDIGCRHRTSRRGIALFLLALAATGHRAHAFHDGGIGDCGGCHNTREPTTNPFNLTGSDPTSTCLGCHEKKSGARIEEHFVSTAKSDMPPGVPPAGLTPGGDFGWLKKEFVGEPAESHGHNVVAVDFGYDQGSTSLAPGGTYPSESFHCTGCHDPHGRFRRDVDGTISSSGPPIAASGSYADSPDPLPDAAVGVYRLLGGIGYQPKSAPGSSPFKNAPPAAVAPRAYNRGEEMSQTRVAYGSGMSEWCANCHVAMHGSKMSHPTGAGVKLGEKISTNYNRYVRTGDVSGTRSNSYLSLVPFEEGGADYAVLKSHACSDDSYLEGPDAKANVSCLSCHRAHASGWNHSLRFDAGSVFITVVDDGGVRYPDAEREPELARGRRPEEIRQAYYGRPAGVFSPSQRTLCGKCHAKD